MNTTTIGIEFATFVFQVSLANKGGRIVERKRLSRGQLERFLPEQPAAEIVMETCATEHHWGSTA